MRCDITTIADAPSLSPEALPAVTVPPSFRNAVRSLPSAWLVVPARGCSSLSTSSGSPFFRGTSIGTISSLKIPSAMARSAFCWL